MNRRSLQRGSRSSHSHAEEQLALSSPAPGMGGLRAGVVVFAGVGLANLSNYLFHLVSARHLGPSSYSDVATLTAVSGIITLPLAGAQAFAARHVASNLSRHRPLNDGGYVSGFGGAMTAAGLVVTVVLLGLSPLLRGALSVASLSAVALTVLITAPGFLAPVLLGAIQGGQRFLPLALALAAPPLLRVALAAGALADGLGVPGVMAATLLGSIFALAIPLVVLRGKLGSLAGWRPRIARSETLALLPVVAGMLAITCLSTDDLVAAKVTFSAHEAGVYGSASLVGRVILYLPAAVVAVLLPKVSARASADHETAAILTQSLLATAAFCLTATALYAAAPTWIMHVVFGPKYAGAAPLLWMFGVAMTLYALLSVLLAYRVGHGETGTCWLLLAGAVAQAVAFAFLHTTPRELLWVSMASGFVLLAGTILGPSSRAPASIVRVLARRRLA